MTLKTNCLKVLIVLSGLALLLDSCRKNLPFCRQNCADININGRVYNKTNGVPFGNIPVEVSLIRRSSCFGCTSYKVAARKTAADGYFNFEVTIDSSLLKDFFLSVRIPTDSNYFISPNPSSAYFSEVRLYDSISNALQNLEFKFYPKTLLTIRLHRTLTDNFDLFTVENIFDSTTGFGYHDIYGPQIPTDTTFRLETSTNIYTRIIWKKRLMGVQLSQQMDSLIAADNGTSVFDINY